MDLEQFYAMVGGNLSEVRARLAKDERILKYLRKFLDSTDYPELVAALEQKNYPDAFRFSHNLKGVAANLGLHYLYEVSSALCEELRHGEPAVDISGMMNDVTIKYNEAREAIALLG